MQLFGERTVGGSCGDEFAQACGAGGIVVGGKFEHGVCRLFGKGLGHFLLDEDRSGCRDDLVRHGRVFESDRQGGIRFLRHGTGTLYPGKRKKGGGSDTRARGKRSFEHETDTFGGEYLSQAGIFRALIASLSDP